MLRFRLRRWPSHGTFSPRTLQAYECGSVLIGLMTRLKRNAPKLSVNVMQRAGPQKLTSVFEIVLLARLFHGSRSDIAGKVACLPLMRWMMFSTTQIVGGRVSAIHFIKGAKISCIMHS